MRKPAFCIWENKSAGQLHGNHTADQHLCFCYMDSTIPLLLKTKISSLYPSLAVGPGNPEDRFSPNAAQVRPTIPLLTVQI